MIGDVCDLLGGHRLRFGDEAVLQSDVERVLAINKIAYNREFRLGGEPIDFLTADGVGIECKVDGGPSAVLAQVLRYAQSDEVRSLLLVTSRHTHRFAAVELAGKPFRVLWIAGNL